jgi:hypothetical protein
MPKTTQVSAETTNANNKFKVKDFNLTDDNGEVLNKLAASVDVVNYPSDVQDAIALYGEEAVWSIFVSGLDIKIANELRAMLCTVEEDEDGKPTITVTEQKELDNHFSAKDYAPSLQKRKTKVDKLAEEIDTLSPEQKEAMRKLLGM